MKAFSVGALVLSALVTVLLATACGSADEEESVASQDQAQSVLHVSSVVAEYAASIGGTVVWGEATKVHGSPVLTWAILSNADDSILEAGVTFGMEFVEEMPNPGDGPAGAFASLQFPEVVQRTTYFNHLEIQPVPEGHMSSPSGCNTLRNSQSHFDFHFYSIPERDVFKIPATAPPSPAVPPQLLPAGYSQPGVSLVQMGRHSSPSSLTRPENDPDYCDTDRSLSPYYPPYYLGTAGSYLIADMIAGFLPDASKMHFIEPMISQEFLKTRDGFVLATPMPDSFGTFVDGVLVPHPMLYPTKFEARFHADNDPDIDTCTMIFSNFIEVK